MKKNIPTLCYGCGTCSGICPNNAVVMCLDRKKGIYLPEIDETRCDDCGICIQVCPWQLLDKGELDTFVYGKKSDDILGSHLGCYVGYSTNANLRWASSSGGLVTALLTFALEEEIIDGALVTRMSKTKPLTPEPFIARTESQINSAVGSKYISVPSNVALRKILREKGEYAVVGLPCHIQGVRKAEKLNEKLNERIVLHLGLICSGTISSHGTNLLFKSLNLDDSRISQICYRGYGWPGGFRAILENGTRTPIIPFRQYFPIIRFYVPLPCLICWDSMNEFSDISFGDAWLAPLRDADDRAKSLIISRTEKGEELLKIAQSRGIIRLFEVFPQEVIKAQRRNLDLKKKNLAMRLALAKVISTEAPNFRNISQLHESRFECVSRIWVLLLFARYMIMSRRSVRTLIDSVLMWLLKSRM